MKTEWLQILVTFAKYNSIAKTSEIHYTSQQNISKIFQQLEKEIGFTVFTKKGRKVILTPAGLEFAHVSEAILNSLENLKMRYSTTTLNELSGEITAIVNDVTTLNIIFESFALRYPKVNLSIYETDFLNAFEHIENNPQIIAILPLLDEMYHSLLEKYNHSFTFIPLSVEYPTLLVSKQSPYAHYKSISYSELNNLKIVMMSKGLAPNKLLSQDLHLHAGNNINIISTNSHNYFYSGISKNLFAGITNLSDYTNCTFYNKENIVPIILKDAKLYNKYLIYHAFKKKFSPAEKHLLQMVIDYYATVNK